MRLVTSAELSDAASPRAQLGEQLTRHIPVLSARNGYGLVTGVGTVNASFLVYELASR